MKIFKNSVLLLALFTVLLGIIYPLFMYGVGYLFFPKQASGSILLSSRGKPVGSVWIGQNFTEPGYFHPRPSLAGDGGYDATRSSGSNLGPTSQKLIDTLRQRALAYRRENRLSPDALIPADAITASASGLDPHISVANALLQVKRVAAARRVSEEAIRDLVAKHTEPPTWGLFGEERVHVLQLNLALE